MPSSDRRPVEHPQNGIERSTTSLQSPQGVAQKNLIVPPNFQTVFCPFKSKTNTNQFIRGNNSGTLGGMDLQTLLASGLGNGNEVQFAGTLVQIANFMQKKSQERDADMESLVSIGGLSL